ncbi:DEAD/DEAH box helicase [Clostridium frigidicarnis]|uniref:Superfamily II DNA or RNA helicase, SNF2 family n=1 Tax=Clostridium frigidicarnis TaxID=84698 RepID=A0A1I0WT41_9CLOT|nr:DEAD/DEAH box helicase [Clostridium frigidicarnis]SFA91932.1 Superfamily II DNA or RNA helicase, SNF2 family [Clostridium frigidicarnis]
MEFYKFYVTEQWLYLNLVKNILEDKIVTSKNYSKGTLYYSSGNVLGIKAFVNKEDETLDINSRVKSQNYNKVYDVNIIADLKEEIVTHTECTCEDYLKNSIAEYTYCCKHIVASTLHYIDFLQRKIDNGLKKDIKNKETGIPNNSKTKSEPENIDDGERLLNSLEENNRQELINIEIYLKYNKLNNFNNNCFEVEFKIGNKKMYILKNIHEFIQSKKDRVELRYGKDFTYYPNRHYFSKDDENLLDFLEEYEDISNMMDGYSRVPYAPKVIKSKMLLIVPTALRRFLQCVKHKNIKFNYHGTDYNTVINIKDIPIEFSVEENKEGLVLKTGETMPEALNSNGDVFFYNGEIYIPSYNQCNKYKPFYDILKKEEKIVFKDEKCKGVLGKILPTLDSISNKVEVSNNIEKNLIRDDLKVEFYFDRNNKEVYANVKLIYGDISFDYIKGTSKGKYLIRNLIKENEVENRLNEFKFYKYKEKFKFIGNDEDLYLFLNENLNKLTEIGQVYYSDRFKDQKIYKSKSIKATVNDSQGNYLDFSFSIGDLDEKEINNILKAFKDKRKFYKLKNNSFVDLEETETKDFLYLLDNLIYDNSLKGKNIKIHKSRAMYLNDSIECNKMHFIKGKSIVEDVCSKMKTIENINYNVPKDLNATLRDYQISGYKWLKTLSYCGFGGILADEMGLGKTIQTIAFLLSERDKKSLIVTPTSLVYNWKSEFEKFAPTMNIAILHGSKEERAEVMKSLEYYDIILTTYGTLINDFQWYENKKFDYCIIDEGQNIKNSSSLSSEAVKKVNADIKFALTGTPIENNLTELWSIFDYVMPGYLYGKSKFQDRFTGKDGDTDSLKRLIKPFILRRLKKEVMMELPEKIERKFFIEMTEEQKKVYKTFVNDIKVKMENNNFSKDKITIFSYLTKLRQLCLDPSVLIEGYNGESAKINVATDIIKDGINNDHKILLFSQFTSVLESIKERLNKEGVDYYYLDGSTKASYRLDMVNEFNSDNGKKLFLISLKAGGTGLNLTGADIVIHFDPWWNPAIEDQATDRAHRIGQKNMVDVIKLIAKGTIEEKILLLQNRKKEMIKEVIDGDFKNESFLSSLNENEINELFS